MPRILIKNPVLIATMDDDHSEIKNGHILIEDEKIVSIGTEIVDTSADEVIDAKNMVVVPGFVNTHHHFYQTLTRNIPKMQKSSLFPWLENHYMIWRELTEEGVAVSTRTAIAELMLSGTTTTSDHLYLFPQKASPYLLDIEIEVAREMGIRFYPTRGSMSLGKSQGGLPPEEVIQSEEEIQKDTERLVNKYHDESDGAMLRIALAPCSPFSVTKELMIQTAEYAKAKKLLIHTHLAETQDEEEFCMEKFNHRPIDYIKSLGWLEENAWFAHAVVLSDDDIQKLGHAGCSCSHCPSSNMRLGSGIARIKESLEHNVNVSLAVDGSASNDSSNMLSELRNALLLSHLRNEQYWLTTREVLWMATRGGAKALGRDDIGQIALGKQADLAIFSLNSMEYAGSLSDPLAALLFTVRMSPVNYLIVNGKIKVKDGKLNFDQNKHIHEHNQVAEKMLNRAIKNSEIDFLKK
jgi:cytosine/adenosine deaminase-related metal-dependent hydrolase